MENRKVFTFKKITRSHLDKQRKRIKAKIKVFFYNDKFNDDAATNIMDIFLS